MSDAPDGTPDAPSGFTPPPVPSKERADSGVSLAGGAAAGLRMVGWLAAALFGLFWCSGVTTVAPGEVAVVLRLGRLVGATPAAQVRDPGLLFALPYPIDEVLRIPVKEEREIDVTTLRPARNSDLDRDDGGAVSRYVLSGDQNVLHADLGVKYRITDPLAFTFGQDDPERVLRDVVTGAVAETVAAWNVDDTLRLQRGGDDGVTARERLADAVRAETQRLADGLALGVDVTAVIFREVQPPPAVAAAFQAVQSERIAIETKKREAEGYAARTIPAAEAERNTLEQEANRYATDLRTRAGEEVAVFDQIYREYVNNPALVWRRLHLETVEGLISEGGSFRFVTPGTRLILTPDAPAAKPAPTAESAPEDRPR